ncbi:hemin uptake protein HemP [Methylobacterium sp. J-090]|uniref:hemin uptake protein HemP n=1 Tax=Methylobacterium sp. J-090 TaxID=2836666 RepID=UPI001FBC07EE|nr:hemin uptake protein HemP [Methylobacterium sp. J-090]MCJ2081798.1 hemin uptake protein HemP [Methylobacterium sp. J-090]
MSDVSDSGRGDHLRDRPSGPLSAGFDPSATPEAGIPSGVLLQGRREIVILHAGAHYRLRVTANDKLILTK